MIQLLERLKNVENETSHKLEELEIWRNKSNYLLKEIGHSNKVSNQSQNFGNNNTQNMTAEEDYKSKFYDDLMKIKLSLPNGHPGKNLLVSEAYEECRRRNIRTYRDAMS